MVTEEPDSKEAPQEAQAPSQAEALRGVLALMEWQQQIILDLLGRLEDDSQPEETETADNG